MNKDLQTMEVKWIRIHPGLGKTQSKIMDILEEETKTWGDMGIEHLTAKVYYPDLHGDTMWMEDDCPITKSQINTVRRAVKALEKRGLVKTMIKPIATLAGYRQMKVVGILSDKY